MIRIGGLALPVDGDLDQLRKRAARTLGVRPGALGELDIVRQSIDARRKDDVTMSIPWSCPWPTRLPWSVPPPVETSL